MNTHDAFHDTVHSAPGGCEALAVRLGMSPAVLRNKANPNAVANVVALRDVERVMDLTSNYSVLHALAQNHGHVCIPVEGDASASDMAVLEMVTKVWSSGGEVAAEVHATLADGRVEPHEIVKVEAAAYRTIQALQAMISRLKGMAEK